MYKFLVTLIVLILTLIVVSLNPKMHKRVFIGSQIPTVELNSFTVKNVELRSDDISDEVQQTKILQRRNNVQLAELERTKYIDSVKQRAKMDIPVLQEKRFELDSYKQAVKQKPNPEKVRESKSNTVKTNNFQTDIEDNPLEIINEFVVWNQWRANICNYISDNSLETQVYHLKKGILFRYSFDVDKNKHITNINVRLVRGKYDEITESSIQDIRRIIKTLDGKSVLQFPSDSNRTSVKVEGGIEMADYDLNLNPGNFNDVETIFKIK